ncbi:MAG: phospho-N-acetylmuramoyl-pentapeptide-transferase [Pseudanabaenaceae cyanobacterium SKYGB_i_bin29]|nr:phospho-N-acetylmuramoyl-pentapeptide-transferase [Pseudanabaenaceae cyanobacterium SKYG29]MDW8421925.1 phospho-N-acetylmuramoyl-pentapeptide-transferase [Pseudanabaenaceae cyanobacterium SKYGB_i_bin29]
MEESTVNKPNLFTGRVISLSLFVVLAGVVVGQGFLLPPENRWGFWLPWALSLVGVIGSGTIVLPWLRQLKVGQVIREEGPQSHLPKAGTPTMGGIFVVPIALLVPVLWTGVASDVLGAALLTLAFMFVGWLDDWLILRYKSNKGISPRMKLGLLGIASVLFCLWAGGQGLSTTVGLPFDWSLSLGLSFWLLALFVLLGSSNATNLTDGLDGLAGGTGAIASLGLALLLYPEHSDLSVFCLSISAAYLGFLWHNHNPARVFMGDTGSLALGGALAAAAILGDKLWGLLILGLLFVWESLSTIFQVAYYKATKNAEGVGKRLFKMAPFHHHLELSGWSELQVVATFYGVGLLLLVVALVIETIDRG